MGVTNFTVLAALLLALSLVIERVLEILKSAYDLIDSRLDLCNFWTARAIKLRDFLQRRLRALEYVQPDAVGQFLQKANDFLLGPGHGYTGTVPTIAGDLVRSGAVKLACKVLGTAFGVIITFSLDLDLFALLNKNPIHPVLGTLATGVAIGLGAGPTHKLITTLEKRQAKSTATPETADA